MKLTLALLADYANVSQEGKLNVLGIFDTVFVAAFPAIHSELRLILRFEAGPAERGYQKEVEIKLLEEDGSSVFQLSGQLTIPKESPTPFVRFDQILSISGLQFDHPGDYRFDILINGQTQDLSLPFHVVVPPQTPATGAAGDSS